MNSFAHALAASEQPTTVVTANGMTTHADSGNSLLNLFFILGASRGQDITAQFTAAWQENPIAAMKALFWARDVREGAGERDTFRKLMQVVEKLDPLMVMKVLPLIPVYGRWDDVQVFETAEVKDVAVQLQAKAIQSGDALSAKWAPRKGLWANLLRKQMGVDPKTYRKTLVSLTQVVETLMCAREWSLINYEKVPSVAGARYQKAFTKHDPVRYTAFKNAALAGDVKIHAATLYPYDVIKSMEKGDVTAAQAQWQVLPNYLGDAGFILPVIDTSGSMGSRVGGKNSSLTCMDVAISLGLYLADKQQGAFKDMFLNFHSHSKIHQLQGDLAQKLSQIQACAWGGSTNLESAFKEILRVAVLGDVPEAEMPKHVLVISDMGFDACEQSGNPGAFDMAKEMFARHNYVLPNIIWWNVSHREGGYGGNRNFPVTAHDANTALISGFSPSIIKSVLQAKSVTPYDVMMDTIHNERYAAVEASLS